MAQLFANAARSTLTASITSSSTQLQINPADQALFPVATGADWFKVALEDSSGNLEYLRVQRAVGQNLLTITERATEDAAKFPARAFVAGSLVELRMTAADLASSIAHPSVASGAHAASAISVTPAGAIAATNVQAALQELDGEKADAAATVSALGGKVSLTGAETIAGVKTFSAQPVLPGNAVSALEAVPKQQAEVIAGAAAASAVSNRMQYSLLVAASTGSGPSVDVTSIPAWATRITVLINGVSTNGTFNPLFQLGSGSYATSGYYGSQTLLTTGAATSSLSGGFSVGGSGAVSSRCGSFVFTHQGSNAWVCSGSIGFADSPGVSICGGVITLAGTLDRLRLFAGGTDQFDGGGIRVLIEG